MTMWWTSFHIVLEKMWCSGCPLLLPICTEESRGSGAPPQGNHCLAQRLAPGERQISTCWWHRNFSKFHCHTWQWLAQTDHHFWEVWMQDTEEWERWNWRPSQREGSREKSWKRGETGGRKERRWGKNKMEREKERERCWGAGGACSLKQAAVRSAGRRDWGVESQACWGDQSGAERTMTSAALGTLELLCSHEAWWGTATGLLRPFPVHPPLPTPPYNYPHLLSGQQCIT